jgi:hypothetical protein
MTADLGIERRELTHGMRIDHLGNRHVETQHARRSPDRPPGGAAAGPACTPSPSGHRCRPHRRHAAAASGSRPRGFRGLVFACDLGEHLVAIRHHLRTHLGNRTEATEIVERKAKVTTDRNAIPDQTGVHILGCFGEWKRSGEVTEHSRRISDAAVSVRLTQGDRDADPRHVTATVAD